MNVLMIDNFDSFTYNLVDELRSLGAAVRIHRNDIAPADLERMLGELQPRLIVLSPGPSSPSEAGICVPLIRRYHSNYPILGICLGHQCLIEAFGGVVERTPLPVHGKKSLVTHTGTPLFDGVPRTFSAGRYHSLCGARIPPPLVVTAVAEGIPMAVEEPSGRLTGLQFHPESILTAHGSRILANVLRRLP
ncbi:MAG TPA: aminodeoxychorismate/anthranilate synthase component II [Acidobacteriota bacterium]|nr:aminodeoxychorismate/anthranilate synthase component II [Acidobacteriota bacterium]HQM62844.1 aminodeoxychorismate/anthranilate synthase component II [Acidobacteriota bacterium]